ncbi:MAG: hypothetical protein P1U82_22115, partial [Verrucomicrobiales bacterium]|nr:hypothetical protein [Verrucomicrobiales bacterium]
MSSLPFMLTERDEDLLGVANRSDAMGVLAIWSARARDLVPHLTEQTTEARGFQILLEAFYLWEHFTKEQKEEPVSDERFSDFFLLVEQAFARIVGHQDKKWSLPGTRRVLARISEKPHISLTDYSWHLLGSQKNNGLWGLYRGAAQRAGLLTDDLSKLASTTFEIADRTSLMKGEARKSLFGCIKRALDGETVELANPQLA